MEERVIVCRSFDLCEDYVNFIVIIEYDEPHSKAQILRLRSLWAQSRRGTPRAPRRIAPCRALSVMPLCKHRNTIMCAKS